MLRLSRIAIALVSAALLASPAGAWGWKTHRLVASEAAEQVGGRLGETLRKQKAALLRGSVAPDREGGKGWIDSRDHVLHPHMPGAIRGGADRVVAGMVGRIASRKRISDAELAFELGRISHIVSDVCQPLHTDGGARRPEEDTFHSDYEMDVNRALEGLAPLPDAGAVPEIARAEVKAHLLRVARTSFQGYDAIERAYLDSEGFEPVRELTARWLAESVRQVVAVWRVLDGPPPEGPPASPSAAPVERPPKAPKRPFDAIWLASCVLALAVFIWAFRRRRV